MKKTKNSLEEACTSGVNPGVQAFFIRRLKVLEISFTSGKPDFPGAVTEIDG